MDTREQKTTFVASLTWIKNNHSFKFGGETRIEGYPNANIINTNGSYAFGPAETGLPYLNATGPDGLGRHHRTSVCQLPAGRSR